MWKCVLLWAMVSALCAQIPVTRRSRQTQQTSVSPLETPVATFHGTLKSVSKKELVLALPADQAVTFYISHKTRFLKDAKPIKSSEIPSGAALSVDGKRDVRGNTEAVTVTVEPGTKPEQPPAPRPGASDAVPPPR